MVNVYNFIANVEAAGCVPLPDEKYEDETIIVILSLNGKRRVFINITDEEITQDLAIDFLFDLELGDRVEAFFPNWRN